MRIFEEGVLGEARAARFLRARGMRILQRRYRTAHGEIDLIAREGEYLCFVEVKYRTSRHSGDALEAVTPLKQARIIRTARVYLMARGLGEEIKCRFDVVGIMPGNIRLVRDAFSLG